LKNVGCNLTAIGRVSEEKSVLICDNKEKKVLENKGFEHFKTCF